ncbi:MAG: hypothetical protein KF799_14910 [Bdellovibrionales bacterium]|nr:hypothetical protein [Bdellovibrionales bacterium]
MRIVGVLSASLCLTLFTLNVQAQSIGLQSIDRGDFEKLVDDFSANSHHTSVSGASGLGDIWGFEVGLVFGATNTPEINRLAQRQDPNANVSRLPHAALLGALTLPANVTLEAGFIPKVGSRDFKFNQLALAAKWTFSDFFFELPVNLALKVQTGKTLLNFQDEISGVPTHFSYENSGTGLLLLVSKDLGILDPYVAFGTVRANGKMVVSGSGAVFSDPDFAASQSATAKRSSTVMMLGTEVKLGVAKFGVEYGRMFSTNSFTGKFSLYF